MNQPNSNKALADLAAVAEDLHDMAEEKIEKAEKQEQVQVVKLDTEDSLRLENMMLRNRVAKMSASLAEKQSKETFDAFQTHLISKLGVDMIKYQLQVNPSDNTVAIVPR